MQVRWARSVDGSAARAGCGSRQRTGARARRAARRSRSSCLACVLLWAGRRSPTSVGLATTECDVAAGAAVVCRGSPEMMRNGRRRQPQSAQPGADAGVLRMLGGSLGRRIRAYSSRPFMVCLHRGPSGWNEVSPYLEECRTDRGNQGDSATIRARSLPQVHPRADASVTCFSSESSCSREVRHVES